MTAMHPLLFSPAVLVAWAASVYSVGGGVMLLAMLVLSGLILTLRESRIEAREAQARHAA